MGRTLRIAITPALLEKLKAEKKRTGQGARSLLRGRRDEHPEGLRAAMIDAWLSGRVPTARKDYVDWVMEAYAEWQPEPSWVDITPDIIAKVRSEIERTNTSPLMLFKNADAPPPFDFRSNNVTLWVKGKTRKTRKAVLDYVLAQYAKLPDVAPTIPITEAMHKELIDNDKRTGLGGVSILRIAKGQRPDGLNHHMIGNWKAKVTVTARADHWDYVITTYRAAPTEEMTSSRAKRRADRITISKARQTNLEKWRKAGLVSINTFESFNNLPDGLTWSMIANWLSGISSTAMPEHLDFIEQKCREMLADKDAMIPITKSMRKNLREAWKSLPVDKRSQLSTQQVSQIEAYLHDTDGVIHPKSWLEVLNRLEKF